MKPTRSAVRWAAGLAGACVLAGAVVVMPGSAMATEATLAAATAELHAYARIPGTAWMIDPSSGTVVVNVDATVTGAKFDRVKRVAAKYGSAVKIERMPGTLERHISGGSAIYKSPGGPCSLGFNVRDSSGTHYFLTAGHCTKIASTWYADSRRTTVLGTRTSDSFPGDDYGIVRYTNSSITKAGTVGSQDIASAATPTVGQSACRRGRTSGTHCGTVTGLNATVNFAEGTVYGLIRSNICSEPGDSGGPLYSGSAALGLLSGGSGNCWGRGGTSFYQPVVEVLDAHGLSIY